MFLLTALLACSTAGPATDPSLSVPWKGPFASLDELCGEDCTEVARRQLEGVELVTYAHGRNMPELAIHTKAGWWHPTGERTDMQFGRHSPGHLEYDLGSAAITDGVIGLAIRQSSVSFGPNADAASTRRRSTSQLRCMLGETLTCWPVEEVFSEQCTTAQGVQAPGDCRTTGIDIR